MGEKAVGCRSTESAAWCLPRTAEQTSNADGGEGGGAASDALEGARLENMSEGLGDTEGLRRGTGKSLHWQDGAARRRRAHLMLPFWRTSAAVGQRGATHCGDRQHLRRPQLNSTCRSGPCKGLRPSAGECVVRQPDAVPHSEEDNSRDSLHAFIKTHRNKSIGVVFFSYHV